MQRHQHSAVSFHMNNFFFVHHGIPNIVDDDIKISCKFYPANIPGVIHGIRYDLSSIGQWWCFSVTGAPSTTGPILLLNCYLLPSIFIVSSATFPTDPPSEAVDFTFCYTLFLPRRPRTNYLQLNRKYACYFVVPDQIILGFLHKRFMLDPSWNTAL